MLKIRKDDFERLRAAAEAAYRAALAIDPAFAPAIEALGHSPEARTVRTPEPVSGNPGSE